MSAPCRFDPAYISDDPLSVLSADGTAHGYAYCCPLCGDDHWCVPAAEADGTVAAGISSETVATVMAAMREAVERAGLRYRPTDDPGAPPVAGMVNGDLYARTLAEEGR